ncbi:MAG: PAS domain-containing sensor histidine kinase [Comamonadaceae bacterium]|nr:MAG: PAS domain-containing sensor histidine kinase [Comamonadaceae bacterium]
MPFRPSAVPAEQDTPFLRLWKGFLTSRAMIAVALILLQGLGVVLNQAPEPLLQGICLAYLVATLLLRVFARRRPPAPHAGPQWLLSIGVDLAFISALQILHTGVMNFTPLFGLPILMAGVLGSLTLAFGTTAAVTILLLAWAWWLGDAGGIETTPRYFQSALTGTGYFIVAYLVHQLSARLITERQVAQQSQMVARAQQDVSALVMQNLSDGVLVVDDNDIVRIANPSALQLLSHSAQTVTPFSLLHIPGGSPLLAMAQRTFRQEAPQSADIDILLGEQRPLGLHVRTWLTSTREEAKAAGSESLCVVFLHDLREMEARLRTEKLAAMGRMSAAVAHEIRNPLAAIVQANALLEEDLKDPVHQRLTRMVQQNAERLNRIAEEVLDIARVQHQISHAPAASLVLDEVVTQVWNDWHAQDPARRTAQLSLTVGRSHVEFDADHLRRVLVNLLDNALRYMGSEPDSLSVSTRVAANGQIAMQVWSDGAPLDKSVERHLFEPFFSSESRSSGLGLYICRELCQRHGASIGYQRRTYTWPRGEIGGNAFTVTFRNTTRPSETASLFDTIMV